MSVLRKIIILIIPPPVKIGKEDEFIPVIESDERSFLIDLV